MKLPKGTFAAVLPGIALVIAMIAVVAWENHSFAAFSPFNGNFQNFNMVSRLAAGQRPFVDYPVYLGLGPLLLPFPLFVLLGGNFDASNVAFDAMNMACEAVAVLLALRLAGWNRPLAWSAAALAVSMRTEIDHASNSDVGIRSFLPFLAAAGLMLLSRLKMRMGQSKTDALAGLLAGLMVGWSNDYGPITACVFGFIWIVHCGTTWRRAASSAAVFFLCAAAGLAAEMTAITGGHPLECLRFLLDTSGDQFWYFNPDTGNKVFSLSDLPHSPGIALCFVATTLPVAMWAVAKRQDSRNAAFATIALGTIGGVLVAGIGGTFEHKYVVPLIRVALLSLVWLTGIAWSLRLGQAGNVRDEDRPEQSIRRTWLAVAMVALASIYQFEHNRDLNELWATLDPTLWVPEFGDTLLSGYAMPGIELARNLRRQWDVEKVPADRRLLSTYSSVLSVVSGSRQDGPDYLIHALGDRARERFAASLSNGYAAVEIPRRDKFNYGDWVMRTSWPFYRSLFIGWHASVSTPWSIVWSRRPAPVQPGAWRSCSVSLEPDEVTWHVSATDPDIGRDAWWEEVSLKATTRLRASWLPVVGNRGLISMTSPFAPFPRHDDLGLMDLSLPVPVNGWSAPLRDGNISFPVRMSFGSQADAGLRAYPLGRASLNLSGCLVRRIVPVGDTEFATPHKRR
jgi:uncharacterized membrane protein YeaQ/YmgE (transglycosylase-associated protein family)